MMYDNHHLGWWLIPKPKLTLEQHLLPYVNFSRKGLPRILCANEWPHRLDLKVTGTDVQRVGGRRDLNVILMFEDMYPHCQEAGNPQARASKAIIQF